MELLKVSPEVTAGLGIAAVVDGPLGSDAVKMLVGSKAVTGAQ